MGLKEKLAGSTDILRKLWFLARPYGLGRPAFVLSVILLQGVLQVAGVTSVFPFLALAADPDSFRGSGLGSRILAYFPPLTNAQLLMWAGLISIVVLVLSNAANLFSDYVRARYAHGFGHWLRLRVLGRITSQPWGYFLGQNTGILLKKATWDVGNMVNNVLLPVLEGLARLVTAILLVVMLLAISPLVAVSAALVLGLYYLVVFVVLGRHRRYLSQAARDADRGAYKEAQQLLGGIKTAKIHHAERFFIERYAQHSLIQAQVNSKTPLHYQAPKYILEPIAFGGVIAVVMTYVASGKNLSDIIPLLGVVGLAGYRLLPAMQLLYAQISQLGANRHALDEIYQEFSTESELGNGSKKGRPLGVHCEPTKWNNEIKFDNIAFKYASASKEVLHGINFVIPRRASLGVIGQTGSGKSTLVDLLMGLHVPSSGRILVDGKPLSNECIGSWQAGLGYVPQDIFLIDDTVARNIALGLRDEEIDFQCVREAATAAQIFDFIESELPLGFNTLVGERGVRLSGGQRQRIALARALYRKPQLLILDEATSALDNETEAQVVEAINNLQGEVTMVVVAHRLSTIQRCQFVLELADGKATMRAQ